jgi:hypothetical protein
MFLEANGAWRIRRHHWADYLENVGTSTSHNPVGLRGLLQGYLYHAFIYNDTRSISNCMALGGRAISEWWISKDVRCIGRSLIWDILLAWTKGNRDVTQDIRSIFEPHTCTVQERIILLEPPSVGLGAVMWVMRACTVVICLSAGNT